MGTVPVGSTVNSADLRRFRLAASAVAATGIVFASGPALADLTKDQCIDANGKGQELRREGSFAAARLQLRQCATPSCPAMVRDDCTRRLDELESAQPTILFDVKDATGTDLIDVRVSVDGQPLVLPPERQAGESSTRARTSSRLRRRASRP